MPLPDDILIQITTQVRGGFEDRNRIIDIFSEEMYEPGELNPTEIAVAVDAAIAEHESEKVHWPDATDCDRLNKVFENLNRLGIISLHNAGMTQSDGFDDFREAYATRSLREKILGYCFYHGQDLDRAVEGGGLYLAFGPVDPKEEATAGPRIAQMITGQLRDAGFEVDWTGTFNKRIFIPTFDWKRR